MSTQNSNKPFRIEHPNFTIEISKHSGFCFGVVNAIKKAEENLRSGDKLYCVGSIVHNTQEVSRLTTKGLEIIDINEAKELKNKSVLFRAHGEPPESYHELNKTSNTLIDATCPVVLKIQQRVKKAWLNQKKNEGQIVIFGKKNHAEVQGLLGQTNYQALLVENEDDLNQIDFNKPIELFSQTTKSIDEFEQITSLIKQKSKQYFKSNDTICRQVSNRQTQISEFAKNFDIVFFVGDPKSSNSKVLYQACLHSNENSHFITSPHNLDSSLIHNFKSFGICGATSTPQWLMENVAKQIEQLMLNQ